MNFIGKKQKIAIFAIDLTVNGRIKWFLGGPSKTSYLLDIL
jgi:hypothetical protein